MFLGIKSYEYYGKYDHDILPGHVAESPRQALDKLVIELDKASGLLPLPFDGQGNLIQERLFPHSARGRRAGLMNRPVA